MAFSKNFNELFVKPDQESKEWNDKVFDYLEQEDIEKLGKHLDTAEELYPEQRQLYTAINTFTLEDESIEEKERLLKLLEQADFVEKLKYNASSIRLDTCDGKRVLATRLTHIIPALKIEDSDITSEKRKGQCHEKSIIISKSMDMDNDVVTGYIYGFSNKAQYLHSWVEMLFNGQEVVIDYTLNIFMNKEGYYYMQNAKPLSRVSNKSIIEDLKTIKKFDKLGSFNIKEYLLFRDEIMKDFKRNKALFEDDEER